MVRMGKLALVLLLAVYVVNADTTSSEVTPLETSELGDLSSLESRLSRSAAGMMKVRTLLLSVFSFLRNVHQGLLGADAATNDASPARRLGEGRVEAGRGTGDRMVVRPSVELSLCSQVNLLNDQRRKWLFALSSTLSRHRYTKWR